MDQAIKAAASLILTDEEFYSAFRFVVGKVADFTNADKRPTFAARLMAFPQKNSQNEYDVLAKNFGQLTTQWRDWLSQAGAEVAEQGVSILMAFFFFEGTRKVTHEDGTITEQDIIVCLGQSLDGRGVRSYLPITRKNGKISVSMPTEPAQTDRDYSMDVFFKGYVNALPKKEAADENTPTT